MAAMLGDRRTPHTEAASAPQAFPAGSSRPERRTSGARNGHIASSCLHTASPLLPQAPSSPCSDAMNDVGHVPMSHLLTRDV